ncbi:MAG: hypothetical protein HKN16_10840 [Saprospiraceae bacterium]|nr:hypothetical protein [Saprospiraceae bacterium]
MNFTKLLAALFLIAGLGVVSCTSDDEVTDPCDGVTCATGETCVDGNCVADNACDGVTCDAGEECIDGDCIEIVTSVTGDVTGAVTWTADQIWVLEGKVVVRDGATLTIEPGTIVKGAEGAEALASALVVARGGMLIADGTATQPIIFTTILDNIKVGETAGTNLTELDNEKWGGVIILGNAPISAKDGDTEANIEGIPANDEYGKFGGDDPADDSGSLKYVSIRHGGVTIGEGNEINGLTLGGVGTGTTIDNIEIFGTLDDGVEYFGGTVNSTNILVTYQGDDGIDLDMNYSGTIDNFVVLHGGSDTDEALEIDGPEGSTHTDGLFTLRNGTLIAVDTEKTSGADLKSKAQGNINKCVWKGYDKHVKVRASYVDGTCDDKSDAWTNVNTGALLIAMCEVEGTIGAAEVARVYVDDEDINGIACLGTQSAAKEMVVDDMVAANSNAVVAAGAATEGADESVFSWTITVANGLL